MLFGVISVAALVVWLLSGMLESPPGGVRRCEIPRSYDVVCNGLIYTNISKESMGIVISQTVGRDCRVTENC